VASVFGFLLMVAGILGLLWRRSLFSLAYFVIVAQVAAVALLVWARVTFGWRSFHFAANPTQGGLVTTGPYRYIRHPIYTAACGFIWAGALAHWSLAALAFAGMVTAGALVRMRCEERLLVERYPEYREYAASTRRMIPYVF
jgi:protein-S-isoprenylcysteine O-methyltransferase Ste14